MDAFYLEQTLTLASRGRGFCAPNPAVGALVVKDGKVMGEGFHSGPGKAHAEVEALKNISDSDCEGATLYVSLEPCCHFGRTPPCTDLIQAKKISKVVYAFEDPNPKVKGKGAQILNAAGIETSHLPLEEARAFYQSYAHWTETGLPWVTAKIALSLDGKVAGRGGAPLRLTGSQLDRFTHQQRLAADALLTTSATVHADDPQMNVRLDKPIGKRVYVLNRLGDLPLSSRLFQTAKSLTVFIDSTVSLTRREALMEKGAEVVQVPSVQGGLSLEKVMQRVGLDGIHDLWIEAGPRLFETLIRENRMHRSFVYIAPTLVGPDGIGAFSPVWEKLLSQRQVAWTAHGRDVACEVVW